MRLAVDEKDDVVRFSLRKDEAGDVEILATRGEETIDLGYFLQNGVLLLTNTDAEKKEEFGFSVTENGEIETR